MGLRIEDTVEDRLSNLYCNEAKDRLHVIIPAGVGDAAWVATKFGNLARENNWMFVLPNGEQHRAGEYLRLLGLPSMYLPELSTKWVWNRDGSPAIPEVGWVSLHANAHLEQGYRIEKWYPDLPTAFPTVSLQVKDKVDTPYLMVFPGAQNYNGGQLTIPQWQEAVEKLETIGPIRMFGAGVDVPFIRRILNLSPENLAASWHVMDQSIENVLAATTSEYCLGVVGIASGPLITSTYQGVKCFYLYPKFLGKMPGTWEPEGATYGWNFLQSLPNKETLSKVVNFFL